MSFVNPLLSISDEIWSYKWKGIFFTDPLFSSTNSHREVLANNFNIRRKKLPGFIIINDWKRLDGKQCVDLMQFKEVVQ